jgi:hypothetical protein
MSILAPAPRTTAWCALALTALATPALASAPDASGALRRTAPPAAAAPAAPTPEAPATPPTRPRVALQLGGLRVFTPVARAAVMHAIQRDAWPALLQCTTQSPTVRGYAAVEISETASGLEVRVSGAPVTRDAALGQCVRRALQRVVMPPHEEETPPTSIAFDLAFGMPAIPGTTPTAAR